ncbi:MAG: translocation/assembly module TamB domain-containing protein, partial [Bdellovibrionales bacterium]|nr:translocation/assembly module TamB domain-containing protein [Bdellovibrionales bacterium]
FSPFLVVIDGINGSVNGGRAVIIGEFNPSDLHSSNLRLDFERASYQISPDTSLTASGELGLSRDELGRLALRGEVEIDSAEFIKEFDLRTLVSQIPELLIGAAESKKNIEAGVPRLELDLSVRAGRNVYVITSFFGAELEGDLKIQGSLEAPLISGDIESLRGWLGLQDARFEISSATVAFRPPSLQPSLNLVAETYVSGKSGQNTLIILEATGPLLSPQIVLSSDQGLSEREILALIGSRSDFRVSASSFNEEDELSLESFRGGVSDQTLLEKLFRKVTRIDSLSFEPKFNARRGLLEPALTAKKNLLPKLDLLGESFLSSPEEGSQLFLRYTLSPKLQLIGTLDTINSENRSSLGLDIAYTALARHKRSVEFQISGNEYFSKSELLASERLSEYSRVHPSVLGRIATNLRDFYWNAGFWDASVEIDCSKTYDTCDVVTLHIEEGSRYTVDDVHFPRHALNSAAVEYLEAIGHKKHYATEELRSEVQQEVIRKLRSDGYLQARVQASYSPGASEDGAPSRRLHLSIDSGRAVTFLFQGNSTFTDRELLETINLFERRQPFGNNTIHLLARN